jgi:Zn-dependent protease with chaperone function
MDTGTASSPTEFPSALFILSELFTTKNDIIILSLTLLILVLYSYIYFKGGQWILKWYGAQKIQQSEKAFLYTIVEELSEKVGVSVPEIFIFESEIPEMFTVGSGGKSFVAVSTSMLEMFNELELKALFAHEIGHIKNNDVGLNTASAFLAGLIMSFPNLAMWCSLLVGFGQPDDPAPKFFKFMATALAAPPAALHVHLTNPAKREFAADKTSIKLTGNPQILAKILENLENYIPLQPVTSKLNPGHFHLFSTHTQQIRGYLSIFISLFDTHPEIEERVVHIFEHSNNLGIDPINRKYSVPGFFDLVSWKRAMIASLISYFILLLGIIVLVTFALKDFNFLVTGIITGVYIIAMLLLMGATARLSRKVRMLEVNLPSDTKKSSLGPISLSRKERSSEINSSSKTKMFSYKKLFLNSRQILKRFIKRE